MIYWNVNFMVHIVIYAFTNPTKLNVSNI
jgi:hypothetical protein